MNLADFWLFFLVNSRLDFSLLFCEVRERKNGSLKLIERTENLSKMVHNLLEYSNSVAEDEVNEMMANHSNINQLKKLFDSLLWMSFNYLKARATLRWHFTFYHLVSKYSRYSFYRPWKDERLLWPWRHGPWIGYPTP